MDTKKINSLKDKLGINDPELITNKQFDKIQKMISEKKLTQEEIILLTQLSPNIVELQKEFINGVKHIAERANNSQTSAFNIIDRQMQTFEILAKSAECDETRIKLAELLIKMSEQLNKVLENMNSDNNNFWRNLAQGTAFTVAVIAAGITGFIYAKNKE
ncbi:hypothetical protein [Avibacterium paragallinarum]|uniref:hypothetical protein n=1 Tax=Avibacterium paragallinarum TaxID=728 RepID=UPI00397CC212